jgi:hypothetical protein
MSNPSTRSGRPKRSVRRTVELALDLRSAFNHSADEIWAELDPDGELQNGSPSKGSLNATGKIHLFTK